MLADQRIKLYASILVATALFTGCGPIHLTLGGDGGGSIDGVARSSEQVATFSYRQPVQDPFGAARVPLALQWTSPSNLNADFDVQICQEDGTDCRTEFSVLCADRYLCGVRLSDGTQISNFRLTKTDRQAGGGVQTTFTLAMCDFGPGSVPSALKMRIQPVIAGKLKTIVEGGVDSGIASASCSVN